jgi:DNA-binding MarR family transcriptional regulator
MAATPKITEFEGKILNLIARSELNALNGAVPKTPMDSATWLFVDDLATDSGLTQNQVKGVLGSLVKKELIQTDDNDDEILVQLTFAGVSYVNK